MASILTSRWCLFKKIFSSFQFFFELNRICIIVVWLCFFNTKPPWQYNVSWRHDACSSLLGTREKLPVWSINPPTPHPHAPPMHRSMHRSMHGLACPSTRTPIRSHRVKPHRNYTILLLCVLSFLNRCLWHRWIDNKSLLNQKNQIGDKINND